MLLKGLLPSIDLESSSLSFAQPAASVADAPINHERDKGPHTSHDLLPPSRKKGRFNTGSPSSTSMNGIAAITPPISPEVKRRRDEAEVVDDPAVKRKRVGSPTLKGLNTPLYSSLAPPKPMHTVCGCGLPATPNIWTSSDQFHGKAFFTCNRNTWPKCMQCAFWKWGDGTAWKEAGDDWEEKGGEWWATHDEDDVEMKDN